MASRLTREFVQEAVVETNKALRKVGILKPDEFVELTEDAGYKPPFRLAVTSPETRNTLLDKCNLRRALDGLETLRALAHFAEFRLTPDQTLISLDDGRQVALMHGGVQTRSTLGGTWSLPLPESGKPHVAGTVYRGEW